MLGFKFSYSFNIEENLLLLHTWIHPWNQPVLSNMEFLVYNEDEVL